MVRQRNGDNPSQLVAACDCRKLRAGQSAFDPRMVDSMRLQYALTEIGNQQFKSGTDRWRPETLCKGGVERGRSLRRIADLSPAD